MYTLDVMHIECNICDNLLKHLFGEKDTLSTRRDMEEVGIRPWLWLKKGVKLCEAHSPICV